MKIRQGFVSNSSSSSFIIAGVRIESDVWENFSDDLREKLEEDHRVLFGSDDGLDDDDVIVGTMLADGVNVVSTMSTSTSQKSSLQSRKLPSPLVSTT